jgi:hypothetical protein
MQIELRPLSGGETLDRTFQIYRARFAMFVGMATVAAAIETAGSAVQFVGQRWIFAHHRTSLLLTTWSGISTLFGAGVALLAISVVFAAMTRATIALHLGEPVGVAQAYRAVWPEWFRYVRLSICVGFLSAWPFLVVLGTFLGFLTLRVGASRGPQVSSTLAFTGAEFFIAAPICVWLLCRYSLSNAACVDEGTTVWKSIQRSVTLSKGLRGHIFLLLLLVYIIQGIVGIIIAAPVFVSLIRAHGHIPTGVVIYELLAGFVVNCVVSPIYAIGLTVLYLDARIRKEGYDIELKMRQGTANQNLPPEALDGGSPGPSLA